MAFLDDLPPYIIVFAVLYCLWIVLALTGNSVLAVAILKSKELRSQESNLLLLSVLVARDLVALCVIPIELLSMLRTEQHLGAELCKICRYTACTSGTATAYSIALLAFERMRSTGSQKKLFPRKWHFALTLAILWALSLIYSIPAIITNDLFTVGKDENGEKWVCGTLPKYFEFKRILIIVDAVVVFIIPFIVVLSSFIKVGKTVVKTMRMETANKIENGQCPRDAVKSEKLAEDKARSPAMKTMQMTLVMVILFGLCTLSPFVLRILAMWMGIKNMWASHVIILFVFTNPWVTWVVFLIFRPDLRKATKDLICRREKKTVVFNDVRELSWVGDLPEKQRRF